MSGPRLPGVVASRSGLTHDVDGGPAHQRRDREADRRQGLRDLLVVLRPVGDGNFPRAERPNSKDANCNMAEIDNMIERSAGNFRTQRELLRAIPARVREESLQEYF